MAKLAREQIIKILAAGNFVSGQELGEQLGMSRTAISKHIKALAALGLDIFSVTGKGYKLAQPIQLIDGEFIAKQLKATGVNSKVEVHHLIDSTNSYLMRKLSTGLENGLTCIAECQSEGRGRRGRQWQSPFGSHIYLSMYWSLTQGMAGAMGLSLVVALAIADTLKALYQITPQLKWPNDIYIDDKKLAGILVELEGQSIGSCDCVIGIGINVNMPAQSAEQIDQPWIDLNTAVSTEVDRNLLIARLIEALHTRLNAHQQNGFAPMLDEWHALDKFYQQQVALVTGEKVVRGLCRGVNSQGALLLEVDGKVQPVYGGEVSLRA